MKTPWNALIAGLPDPHLLQTLEWGEIKKPLGWQPQFMVWRPNPAQQGNYSMERWTGTGADLPKEKGAPPLAAAMMLVRQFTLRGLPTPFKLAYVPKGPLMDWGRPALRSQVLRDLTHAAYHAGAFLLKIDPDVRLGTGIPRSPEAEEDPIGQLVPEELASTGWSFSPDQIQFRNTVLLNLEPDEEALLKQINQKTRYNIRLAARKGVEVRRGSIKDLDLLYRLYAATSVRDGFVIRSEAYYRNLWQTFMQSDRGESLHSPSAVPLIAEVAGEAIAAVVIFQFAGKAWFIFGMSGDAHRNLMPNYLLQWEAMKLAKSSGCTAYDLWGAPDQFNDQDSLWGVFRFKQGFQGDVVRTLGAWDRPLRPLQYRLYTRLLPALLNRMRRRGKAKTERSIAPH